MIIIKEDTKKMAELLKSGHTMLNLSCPVCSNPIFQSREGIKFCPICNRKVIIASETNEKFISPVESTTNINEPIGKKNGSNLIKNINSIYEKIDWLLEKLKDEKQYEMIEQNLNSILKCIKLLRSLEKASLI